MQDASSLHVSLFSASKELSVLLWLCLLDAIFSFNDFCMCRSIELLVNLLILYLSKKLPSLESWFGFLLPYRDIVHFLSVTCFSLLCDGVRCRTVLLGCSCFFLLFFILCLQLFKFWFAEAVPYLKEIDHSCTVHFMRSFPLLISLWNLVLWYVSVKLISRL